jgi:hypothetical protein
MNMVVTARTRDPGDPFDHLTRLATPNPILLLLISIWNSIDFGLKNQIINKNKFISYFIIESDI